MKKLGFLILIALWVLAGIQLVYGKDTQEDKIVQVFAQVGTQEQESVVEYYGVYKREFLNLEEREEFLRQTAQGLGIEDPVQIVRKYGEEREETQLIKEAKGATTTLRLITSLEEEPVQYLIANISMKGAVENALAYREKLLKILDGDMKDGRSSANVIGCYEGNLTLEERNQIADEFLKEMGARVVSEHRDMQLYTIYGYTPDVKEYELQENQKVNLNFAMYYSQTEDKTYAYAAIPVIGLDY